jgi:hypothetical protein
MPGQHICSLTYFDHQSRLSRLIFLIFHAAQAAADAVGLIAPNLRLDVVPTFADCVAICIDIQLHAWPLSEHPPCCTRPPACTA